VRIANSIAVVRAPSTRLSRNVAQVSDAGSLGRREQAAVDAAHDKAEQQDHAPNLTQRLEALRPRGTHAARAGFRIAPDDPLHGDAEQDGRQDAGDDAGCEQLADIGLGDDAVQHHDGRRRDQDAERAAGAHGRCREPILVADPLHRGVGDLGHGGRGGD
jgi:hypothetical protein